MGKLITNMVEDEKKSEEVLHLGADMAAEIVIEFREQTRDRKFIAKHALEQLVAFWLGLSRAEQRLLYDAEATESIDDIIERKIKKHLPPVKEIVEKEIGSEDEDVEAYFEGVAEMLKMGGDRPKTLGPKARAGAEKIREAIAGMPEFKIVENSKETNEPA